MRAQHIARALATYQANSAVAAPPQKTANSRHLKNRYLRCGHRIGQMLGVRINDRVPPFSTDHGHKACWSNPIQSTASTNKNDSSARMQTGGQVERQFAALLSAVTPGVDTQRGPPRYLRSSQRLGRFWLRRVGALHPSVLAGNGTTRRNSKLKAMIFPGPKAT
jgi:hypothetical protein